MRIKVRSKKLKGIDHLKEAKIVQSCPLIVKKYVCHPICQLQTIDLVKFINSNNNQLCR